MVSRWLLFHGLIIVYSSLGPWVMMIGVPLSLGAPKKPSQIQAFSHPWWSMIHPSIDPFQFSQMEPNQWVAGDFLLLFGTKIPGLYTKALLSWRESNEHPWKDSLPPHPSIVSNSCSLGRGSPALKGSDSSVFLVMTWAITQSIGRGVFCEREKKSYNFTLLLKRGKSVVKEHFLSFFDHPKTSFSLKEGAWGTPAMLSMCTNNLSLGTNVYSHNFLDDLRRLDHH